MVRTAGLLAAALAFFAGASHAAAAVTYGFGGVTQNNATNVATGEAQLSVTVSDNGGGTVLFQFNNAGPLASSITDIYFDDNSVPSLFTSGITSIINSSGVSFSAIASPGNLPGGTGSGFSTTDQLSADSSPPAQPNGVNPGETLGVVLTLANGSTYNNVITALNNAVLRVGIHVQGFSNGGSESFINTPGGGTNPPPPVVPEPSSLVLMGLSGLGLAMRRRAARTNARNSATP